ncbi:hypothetical protein ACFXKX_30165 [Streptomyces scopuliridis]
MPDGAAAGRVMPDGAAAGDAQRKDLFDSGLADLTRRNGSFKVRIEPAG